MNKKILDAHKDDAVRRSKSKKVTIFAGGVLSSTPDETIISHFEQFCTIYNFRRMFNKERRVAGYAFFEVDAKHVHMIVESPHMIGQALVNCKVAADTSMIQQAQKSEMERKVFVSNLPPKTTDVELLALFKVYGPVTKAYMVRNRTDGSYKNFGFVVFEDVNDLKTVLDSAEQIKFKGRRISLKQAVDRLTISKGTACGLDSITLSGESSTSMCCSSKKAALGLSQQITSESANYRFNVSLNKVSRYLDRFPSIYSDVKPMPITQTSLNSNETIEW